MGTALTSAIGPSIGAALTSAFVPDAAPPPSGPTYDPTRSLQLNRVDQYASAGPLFAGYAAGPLTVAFWAKADTTSLGGVLGASLQALTVNGNVGIRWQSSSYRMRIQGSTGFTEVRGTATHSTATWVHVMFVWAGTGVAYPQVYFDNVLDAAATTAGLTTIGTFDDTLDFEVGTYYTGAARSYFGGALHLLRIAHVALDSAQRAEWYASGPPAEDSVTGTHAYLTSTDDTSPGTLYDLVGDEDLTPVNSPTLPTDAP